MDVLCSRTMILLDKKEILPINVMVLKNGQTSIPSSPNWWYAWPYGPHILDHKNLKLRLSRILNHLVILGWADVSNLINEV